MNHAGSIAESREADTKIPKYDFTYFYTRILVPMSISIEIPENLYRRLQKHAIPFVDQTPLAVIERWADHFDAQSGGTGSKEGKLNLEVSEGESRKKFSPTHPPDLFHTRARGTFGATPFSNWNDLLRIAHIAAFAKANSFDGLRTRTQAQIRKGNHSDSGYRFVPEIGVSIQGVDANHAWGYALQLAKYVSVPLQAFVEWRHNVKASHPGERAILEWVP